jgi:hypothetical protein
MRRSQCCMCDGWIDKPPFSLCDDCSPKGATPPPLPPDEIRQLYTLAGRPPSLSVPAGGGVPFNGAVWSTQSSPVADLVATFEQFQKDHPPPEPFTMRQIAQAIAAAKTLGIRPESLLRALGQYPFPEPERMPVIYDPAIPPDRMEWVTVSRLLPVVICLDADDVPPPSTECEDMIEAELAKRLDKLLMP